MYEEASLPEALFPKLSDGAGSRIARLAKEHGLLLGPAEEKISMRVASLNAATTLGLPQGSLVLVLDRVVRTIDGAPIEWRLAECNLGRSHYLAQIDR